MNPLPAATHSKIRNALRLFIAASVIRYGLGLGFFAATLALAADHPQWGNRGTRNMASSEKHLPSTFEAALPQVASAAPAATPGAPLQAGKNMRWVARLGTKGYSTPVVAGGKVYVAANSETHHDPRRMGKLRGGGGLYCFDEKTGQFVWQLLVPRYRTSNPLFNYDNINYGICSTPVVEGKRLYVVSNRDELLCVDTAGQANGNDGPFTSEARFMDENSTHPLALGPTDGDIVWRVDFLTHPDVSAWPQDADDCSILLLGDYLYVSPSNGVDKTHKHIPRPQAPSLVVVDKKTGRIVARDDAKIGPKIIHGEWSSPAAAKVGGRTLIFWGGGDGFCYALEAQPTPPAPGERLGRLKVVWRFDVNAAGGRFGAYRTVAGPSEIIATPVFYKNRVYVDVGQDPTHGKGRGVLACIDATGHGDITKTGKVWVFDGIDRSLSTVAIADGLLYVADNSGRLFCLDADSGKQYWMFDTKQSICSSPLVADGKVYLGTDSGYLWVFGAGRRCRMINKLRLDSTIGSSPVAANGTLYVASLHYLYAAGKKNGE